jgi:imidazolonepropionase-like amidohydrolase
LNEIATQTLDIFSFAGAGKLMREILALFLILLLHGLLLAQITAVSPPRPLVLTHVTVIDVTGAPSKSDMTVLVVGNRIAALGKSGKIKVPQGAQVVDATGKYLIPGLWDMHVHTLREERVETFFPLFIANGITGIRDMGAPLKSLELLTRWRKEIQQETRFGPRIFASGAVLGGARPQNTIAASNEAQARQAVITLKQNGADFIKVYSLLSRAAFFAAADEAKKQGLSFVGHVPISVTAVEASDAGQKSMEHLYGILEACSTNEAEVRKEIEQAAMNRDSWTAWGAIVRATDRLYGRQAREQTFSKEKCAALFARFVKNGTWHCPTLVMRRALALREDNSFKTDARLKYIPQSEANSWNPQNDTRNINLTAEEIADRKIHLEKETELVGEMHRAGVKILAGTDLGNPYIYPGFSLHDELLLLVQAGLTPLEALQTATVNPAKFFGQEKEFGTVEKGRIADLVLLEANPLANISNTQRIHAVIVNGRYLSRDALHKLLAEAEAAPYKVQPR